MAVILLTWKDNFNGREVTIEQVHNGKHKQDIGYRVNGKDVDPKSDLQKKVFASFREMRGIKY